MVSGTYRTWNVSHVARRQVAIINKRKEDEEMRI